MADPTIITNFLTVDYIHRFITSLVFTSIVETAVLLLLFQLLFRKKEWEKAKVIFAGAFASFATIPYVWFVFPYFTIWSRSESLLYSEPFVFAIEALFYRMFLKTGWKASFLLSFACNAASYALGPLLRSFGVWIYW